jgi:hypothetical protein
MKKLLILLLVLGMVSSVSAATYDIAQSLTGTTSTNDGVGLQGIGGLMYMGGAWGTNGGPDGMAWQKFNIPTMGAIETIVSVTLDTYVYGYNAGRPWSGVEVYRVPDPSWTTANISNSWSVADRIVVSPPSPGHPEQPWTGLHTNDVTSWWGAGKNSLTGGETVSVNTRLYDFYYNGQWSNIDPCRAHPAYSVLHITTIPEPATIALLGLGGLALLRRKR